MNFIANNCFWILIKNRNDRICQLNKQLIINMLREVHHSKISLHRAKSWLQLPSDSAAPNVFNASRTVDSYLPTIYEGALAKCRNNP